MTMQGACLLSGARLLSDFLLSYIFSSPLLPRTAIPTTSFSLARGSHVPPVDADRHLPEKIYQQSETLATGLEDRHQPLDEHLGALC
jgi:hypothetical protein